MRPSRLIQTVSLAVLALAVLASAAPSGAAQRPDPALRKALTDFRAFFARTAGEAGIVGCSILLLHDNQVVDKIHYGQADREKGAPAGDHTVYHWASITKTMTGIAILQLRDRGLLSLDDPIVKYIPELRQVHNPFGDMGAITLRHLLTHSAGFRGATWPWKDKDWQPHEPTRWDQLAAMFPYTEIEFEPGSRWSYSNPGIIFLGRVLEILTGDDFEVYVDKNILKPLEMHESYFDATPYHLLKNRARSYAGEGGELKPAPFDVDTGITVSNGGLNAPIADFAKYLDFLMGNPARREAYDGILQRASLEEMWRPALKIGPDGAPAPGSTLEDERQGLIFFLETHFGVRYVAHSGHQNAFVSHFYLQPESRTAYVVAYNTYATAKEGTPPEVRRGTDWMDREVRTWLFTKVFPLLTPAAKAAK